MWRRRKVAETYTLRVSRQPGGARQWTPVVAASADETWTIIQQGRNSRTPFSLYNSRMMQVADLFEIRGARGQRNKLVGELGARKLVEVCDADEGRGEVTLTIRDMDRGEFLHDHLLQTLSSALADAAFGENYIPF